MEGSTRRLSLIEEVDGLASLSNLRAGFSGNNHHHHLLLMRSSGFNASMRRGSSDKAPSSPRFYESSGFKKHHHQPHFLEACYLCNKPLRDNRDIFMYRGDTPFCSEECRQEQIEMDEAKETNWNLSAASMKALRKEQKKKTSTTPPSKAQNYSVRTSTVAALEITETKSKQDCFGKLGNGNEIDVSGMLLGPDQSSQIAELKAQNQLSVMFWIARNDLVFNRRDWNPPLRFSHSIS